MTRLPLDSDPHWTRWPRQLEQSYVQAGVWTNELLGDLAARHAVDSPEQVAVTDPRRRLTYAELETEVRAVAGSMRARCPRGARVVVQLPNCVEFVVGVLALWRAGLVPVMSLPAQRHHEIASFVEQADAAAYLSADRISDFDQVALAQRLRAGRPALQHWVVPGAGATITNGRALPVAAVPWSVLLEGDNPSAWHGVDLSMQAGDLALLQLSGGSTGDPKLIPRTHRDYLYSVRASVQICEFSKTSVQLVVLPAAHNFALSSAGVLGALLAGGRVIMAPDASAAVAFDLIERESVTVASVVPPIALLWLAAKARSNHDLSSLRLLQVGGAKLSLEAARRIQPEMSCELQQVFGMAEGLVSYTRLTDDADTVQRTQGRPMSGYDEVLVLDDDDRPLPDGEPGHLVAAGPYTIRSYYRAPELQSRCFTGEGYYRTGDLVVRDDTGSLTVVGRAKEQINRGGEKVASEEIENHLLAHPAVHEASVVGEPDRMLGERIVAYVVLRLGGQQGCSADTDMAVSVASTRAFLAARGLATYKMPDAVRVVQALPRTGVGKTATTQLRQIAAGLA